MIAISFFACKQKDRHTSLIASLSLGSLFNIDSVASFIKQTPIILRDSSQKIFLNAIDVFINQKNPKAATDVFVKALLVYPNANGYYELGNAYLESGMYNEGLLSYRMAEKLDYKPLNAVLFKQACCYAELDDAKAFDYLSYAIENGFVNRDKIFNEPHFKKIRSQSYFTETYNDAMAGNGNPDAILWEGYSREFAAKQFPYTIDTGSYRMLVNTETISYDYEKFVTEMRDNKFSRDVGNEFFYFAKISANDSLTVVIYGSRSYSGDDEATPVYYYLAAFNSKGNLLDKKLIAGQKLEAEPMKVCNFKSSTNFEITSYENVYEKTKDSDGNNINKVIKRNLQKIEKFIINTSGKIIAG